MRRTLLFLALVAALAIPAAAYAKGPAKAAKTPVTLTGEIVDTGCFLDHGARGEKHKACATKCLTGGMPASLLTDKGELYLLLLDQTKPEALSAAKDLAAEKVEATGTVIKSHGMLALNITSVKKL